MKKWGIKPGVIASFILHLHDSHITSHLLTTSLQTKRAGMYLYSYSFAQIGSLILSKFCFTYGRKITGIKISTVFILI